jgi:F0F1-type ATP synthase membrane subunit b/b'
MNNFGNELIAFVIIAWVVYLAATGNLLKFVQFAVPVSKAQTVQSEVG